MKILIESRPHAELRYDTQGDYFVLPDGTLKIEVMEVPDERYMALVAVHELIEALSCKFKGITIQQVDDFDFSSKADDPGMESDAPYRKQHLIATGQEMILAAEWDVDWKQYEQSLIDHE